MFLCLKKPTFTTSPIMLVLALLIYHIIIINSMQSMYTTGNINITDSRNTFGSDEDEIK